MSFRDRLKLPQPKPNGKHVEVTTDDFLADLEEEMRAQSEQVEPSETAGTPQGVTVLSPSTFPLQVQSQSTPSDLETNGRLTLFRMIKTTELEQPFVFKTARFGGEAYVQTMRTVLSRARGQMREENKKGTAFKLFLISVETKPDHDLVTVMRSTHSSLKQRKAYDDLTSILTDGEENGDA